MVVVLWWRQCVSSYIISNAKMNVRIKSNDTDDTKNVVLAPVPS